MTMKNDLHAAIGTLERRKHYLSECMKESNNPWAETNQTEIDALAVAISALRDVLQRQPDPITGLVPCGCGEWIYTIEKGSCMDYHVTAKCSECGWDWFSKDGVGNFSAVFSAFITNGDSKRDEAERFLIENAKANNKLNYCPNCGAKMENKP